MIAIRPGADLSRRLPRHLPRVHRPFLADNMSKWIPVGLTGTSDADVLESFRNANGTVNTSSTISKTIGCVLPNNPLTNGTDQASPFDFATAYLLGTSASPRHARPGVPTGIIFETDGTPQTNNYTCQQAQTAANTAKAQRHRGLHHRVLRLEPGAGSLPRQLRDVVAQDGRPVAGRHGDQLGHRQTNGCDAPRTPTTTTSSVSRLRTSWLTCSGPRRLLSLAGAASSSSIPSRS